MGWRSSSSVGGTFFSGRMRCLNETGRTVSDPIHRSETIRKKYWGGSGSKMGTNILRVCSSSENFCFSRKNSWWRTRSESTSSTNIQNPSLCP